MLWRIPEESNCHSCAAGFAHELCCSCWYHHTRSSCCCFFHRHRPSSIGLQCGETMVPRRYYRLQSGPWWLGCLLLAVFGQPANSAMLCNYQQEQEARARGGMDQPPHQHSFMCPGTNHPPTTTRAPDPRAARAEIVFKETPISAPFHLHTS